MAHLREVARKKAPNGIAYEVRWLEGDKFRQRTFTSKRDAERHAARVETAKATGEATASLTQSRVTVANVVAASLAASKPGLKPRTYDGNVRLYNGRVLPEFGHKRVTMVTRADLDHAAVRRGPRARYGAPLLHSSSESHEACPPRPTHRIQPLRRCEAAEEPSR